MMYGTADKKVMEKNENQQKLLIRTFFLKKRVRIDTQFAIKIQNTISEGTSYLRAFEASGSCFKTTTYTSRG